jgi:hypothetical protein
VKSKGIREWDMGFGLPNCFFFSFRVKSKGIREWDMGCGLPNCFFFFFRVEVRGLGSGRWVII